jgi:thiosulfate dehydrogenase
MRSCNGTRPPLGSEVSVAVTAYITSLSQDMPMQMNPKRPIGPGAVKQLSVKENQADVKRGASLYAARCAECHQKDGQGDKDNPPVWGERS